MRTYKSIKHLERRLKLNTGFKVFCWDDWGLKVEGKTYFMQEYGDMDGHQYVTFRNLGRKGKHKGLSEPIGVNDIFITVEYNLNWSKLDKSNTKFEFILLRENW